MVTEERSNEIKKLRSKLDEYMPLIKAIMAANPGYKNDSSYTKMLKEISEIENQL